MVKVPMDMPENCLHCPFFSDEKTILINPHDGIYKRIARCLFAPEEIEDPWRNIHKILGHKEAWCPLVEVED